MFSLLIQSIGQRIAYARASMVFMKPELLALAIAYLSKDNTMTVVHLLPSVVRVGADHAIAESMMQVSAACQCLHLVRDWR